jgi:hypothetical protein
MIVRRELRNDEVANGPSSRRNTCGSDGICRGPVNEGFSAEGAVRLDSAECPRMNTRKYRVGRAIEYADTKLIQPPRPCVYGCGAKPENRKLICSGCRRKFTEAHVLCYARGTRPAAEEVSGDGDHLAVPGALAGVRSVSLLGLSFRRHPVSPSERICK